MDDDQGSGSRRDDAPAADADFGLAFRVASRTGGGLFDDVVAFMAGQTGCRLAMICERPPDEPDVLRVLAASLDRDPCAPWTYRIEGTPCATVLSGAPQCYQSGVASAFPDDRALADLGLESFAGHPLVADDGTLLGVISLADSEPFADPKSITARLALMAGRVTAEIVRERLVASVTRDNAFRTLLSEVSSDLLALEPHAGVDAFGSIIGKIGRFYRADRVTLYRYDAGKVIAEPVGRWRADGGLDEEPEIPKRWREDQFENLRQMSAAGRTLSVQNVDDLPEGFANVVRAFGMRSFVNLPVLDGEGRVMGGLAIYSKEAGMRWTEQSVRELDLVSKFFTSTALRISAAERERELSDALTDALGVNPDGVVLVDLETGGIVTANNAYAHLLGLEVDEVVGRPAPELLDEPARSAWASEWQILAESLAHDRDVVLRPFQFVRLDGRRVSMEYSATRVVYRGRPHAFCITRDLSALNHALDLLEQTQALAHVGAFAYDVETGEIEWTEEAYRIHGLPPGSRVTERALVDVYTRESRRAIVPAMRDCIEGGRPFDLLTVVVREGERRRVRVIGRPESVGGKCRIVRGTYQDITDLHRVTAERGRFEQQLRRAAAELAFAEERERQRLATELHDDIVQDLGALKISLGQVEKAMRDSAAPEHGRLLAALDRTQDVITKARALMYEISPPVLYELGVYRAIEWLTEKLGSDTEIEAVCDIEPGLKDLELGSELRIVLFQAVRELLTNVRKHSRASRCEVRCAESGARIVLVVEDDGIGLDPRYRGDDVVLPGPGGERFGIFNLRHRIEYVGGTLRIEDRDGGGTRITLELPTTERLCGRAAAWPVAVPGP